METDFVIDVSLLSDDAEQAFILIPSNRSTAPDAAKREILLTCV